MNGRYLVVQQVGTQMMTLAIMSNVFGAIGAMAGMMFGFSPTGRVCPVLPRFAFVPVDDPQEMELKEIFDEIAWSDKQVQASTRAQAENTKIALVLRRVLSHAGEPNATAETKLAQENLAMLGRWYPSAINFVQPLRQVLLYIEENKRDAAREEVSWLLDCVASAIKEAEEFREKANVRGTELDKERRKRVSKLIQKREVKKRVGRAGPSWYEELKGAPGVPAGEPSAAEKDAQRKASTEHKQRMDKVKQRLIAIERKQI